MWPFSHAGSRRHFVLLNRSRCANTTEIHIASLAPSNLAWNTKYLIALKIMARCKMVNFRRLLEEVLNRTVPGGKWLLNL